MLAEPTNVWDVTSDNRQIARIRLPAETAPAQPHAWPPGPPDRSGPLAAALNAKALQQLGATAAPADRIELTPANPGVDKRGYLDWYYPANVDGRLDDYSSRFDGGKGYLIIGIYGPVNSQHLVTCYISPYPDATPMYTINPRDKPDDDPPLASLSLGPSGHLVFALQLSAAGWNGFALSSKGGFMFYGCDVTPIA